MKILFLSESTASTGGTKQLLLLGAELAARGHSLAVACRPSSILNGAAARGGMRVFNLNFRSDADVASGVRLAALCRRERFDILQTFHPRAHAAALMAKYFGAPGKLVVRRGVIFPIPGNPFSRFKYASARIACLVAVNDTVREEFLKAGVEPARTAVIPPGIDQERWSGAAEGRRSLPWAPPFRIAVVGHYSHFKGHDLLIKAAPAVLKEFPGTQFVMIGRGAAELKAMAEAAGLSGSVSALGPRDDVPVLMAGLHIVAAPSRQEGIPNALIEAQASGVPVVGAEVGGIPAVIEHGRTGLLFPKDDADALAAALLSLLRDPGLAARLSAAGPPNVSGKFSIKAAAERFERVYRAALEAA